MKKQTNDKERIRAVNKAHRRSLSLEQRQEYAEEFAQRFAFNKLFTSNRLFACYMANEGELDLMPLIKFMWQTNRECYLPALNAEQKTLNFHQYTQDSKLKKNRFGISEPTIDSEPIAVEEIDVILVPTVALDAKGNRLGMGQGYYDRTLAFKQKRKAGKPHICGVAYDFQKVSDLTTNEWDVSMDYIATESSIDAVIK